MLLWPQVVIFGGLGGGVNSSLQHMPLVLHFLDIDKIIAQTRGLYLNPIQNGAHFKSNSCLTLTGYRFGQGWRTDPKVSLLFLFYPAIKRCPSRRGYDNTTFSCSQKGVKRFLTISPHQNLDFRAFNDIFWCTKNHLFCLIETFLESCLFICIYSKVKRRLWDFKDTVYSVKQETRVRGRFVLI